MAVLLDRIRIILPDARGITILPRGMSIASTLIRIRSYDGGYSYPILAWYLGVGVIAGDGSAEVVYSLPQLYLSTGALE